MNSEKPTVLLVDDDPDLLETLESALQSFGFDTILGKDGEEGRQLFDEHNPPLVISDISMPKKNGLELLAEIKKASPETVVILITGFVHCIEMAKNSAVSPDALISKPFRLSQLMETIKDVYRVS